MKSFKKFAFLTLLPLIITAFVSVLLHPSLKDFETKIVVFSIGYFAIVAFNYVYIFERLQLKKPEKFKNSIIAVFSVLICSFIYGFAYQLISTSKINLFASLFQTLLSVIVLTLEFAILKIFYSNKQRNLLNFSDKPLNYLLIVCIISITQTIFLSLFLIELLKVDGFHFFKFCLENFLFRTFTITSVAMLSLYILSLIKHIRNSLYATIALATIVSYFSVYAFGYANFQPTLIINYLVIAFSSTILSTIIILYRNKQKETNLKINTLTNSISKKEAEYLQLKNQVNPHFLFNNLNTLISFIEIEPKKAVEFGHHLSNVYRHYLKNQTEDFVSLSEELHFINEYLEIYKAKFESGFTFEIEKNTSKNQYILSLSLQEIIDNIFKHNILDDENPIIITIIIQEDFLAIKNSINIQTEVISNNKGLANINKRTEILLDREISINQNSNFFEVRIPIAILEK